MKNNFKFLFVALAVFCCAIFAVSCSTPWKGLQASLPDLSGMPDGVYQGSYHVIKTPVSAAVDVTLLDGTLKAIEIKKHVSSPVGKKAEKIIERIIAAQSLDVDAVSGATASSTAILKAVENALQ